MGGAPRGQSALKGQGRGYPHRGVDNVPTLGGGYALSKKGRWGEPLVWSLQEDAVYKKIPQKN